ncbi:MAG: hypothetical protein AAGI71_19610 [Bacteroidota bacterium]
MPQVCIHIPATRPDQSVEVGVSIDGVRRIMDYRVLTCDWTAGGTDPVGRYDRLRRFVQQYQDEWELVQIGRPDRNDRIPVTFRQHVQV